MRAETRRIRKSQIENAAYALLESNGFTGMSMLSVAKMAKASNETLYRWYGDKTGLFTAMVESNALEVKSLLETDIAIERAPLETLASLGPKLLSLLVSPRAIALNRAAAANASGELGAALAAAGRETIVPLIARVFQRGHAQGHFPNLTMPEAAEIYVNLLVGDLQIRRVTGVMPQMSDKEIAARSKRALALLSKLGVA